MVAAEMVAATVRKQRLQYSTFNCRYTRNRSEGRLHSRRAADFESRR